MSCCTVLHEVTGTGPNGRITKKDAEQARTRVTRLEQNSAPDSDGHAPANSLQRTTNGTGPVTTLQPGATGGRRDASAGGVQTGQAVTAIEHSRIRRAVATRSTASKQTIPHFYVRRSARINDLMRLRAELNEASKQRISINDMVIRAVAVAHKQIPEANVVCDRPVDATLRRQSTSTWAWHRLGNVTRYCAARGDRPSRPAIRPTGQRRQPRPARLGGRQHHRHQSRNVRGGGVRRHHQSTAVGNSCGGGGGGATRSHKRRYPGCQCGESRYVRGSSGHRRSARCWMAVLVAAIEHPIQLLL